MTKDDFLEVIKFICNHTRLIAFSNFRVPKERTRDSKLLMTSFDIIITTLQITFYMIIIIANGFYFDFNFGTKLSLATLMDKILKISGISILLSNLYIETRYRSRIWFMISGMCDFDIVVRRTNFKLFLSLVQTNGFISDEEIRRKIYIQR